jgi:hypothetical protein
MITAVISASSMIRARTFFSNNPPAPLGTIRPNVFPGLVLKRQRHARAMTGLGAERPAGRRYACAPGRGGEHLEKLLVNYRGFMQRDALLRTRSYPRTGSQSPSPEARVLRDAERGDAAIAIEAVAGIAQIYASRRTCAAQVPMKDVRGTSADERHAARQTIAGPAHTFRVLPLVAGRECFCTT